MRLPLLAVRGAWHDGGGALPLAQLGALAPPRTGFPISSKAEVSGKLT